MIQPESTTVFIENAASGLNILVRQSNSMLVGIWRSPNLPSNPLFIYASDYPRDVSKFSTMSSA